MIEGRYLNRLERPLSKTINTDFSAHEVKRYLFLGAAVSVPLFILATAFV